jgi:DNA invertase Pin-like site-specific DNA recombinase
MGYARVSTDRQNLDLQLDRPGCAVSTNPFLSFAHRFSHITVVSSEGRIVLRFIGLRWTRVSRSR